ncbi:MAG: hypothetical protein ACI94O_002558, partial [Octadecabacter sp.]
QYFCFRILSRWAALNLCGNYRILNETEIFRIRCKPIHATTPSRATFRNHAQNVFNAASDTMPRAKQTID